MPESASLHFVTGGSLLTVCVSLHCNSVDGISGFTTVSLARTSARPLMFFPCRVSASKSPRQAFSAAPLMTTTAVMESRCSRASLILVCSRVSVLESVLMQLLHKTGFTFRPPIGTRTLFFLAYLDAVRFAALRAWRHVRGGFAHPLVDPFPESFICAPGLDCVPPPFCHIAQAWCHPHRLTRG